MALAPRLQKWFPWTRAPVICNGPMLGAATPALATEVTKAGGIGFLASAFNLDPGSPQLSKLDADLTESRRLLDQASPSPPSSSPLRIGISFITGHASIARFAETALPIIAKHRPAIVWLFAPAEAEAPAPSPRPHRAIIEALRKSAEESGGTVPRVFVQVGNVAAARAAVDDGADVLVCQGVDAGGHQFRRGAGVVSLVPEVRAMLDGEFAGRDVGVLAAGGIATDKAVAAMMALEAEGIVMGTKFTVARESEYPDHRKQLILETVDGGSSTLKSPFHDQMNKSTLWGPLYDGRAIVGPIHGKFLSGSSLEDCQRSLDKDYSPEEATRMLGTWAGTGVGLVQKAQPAGEIVRELREGAKEHLRKLAGLV
ncbi:nitronate monooxygenase domain-containing protein [Hirsutella rhossiliensis]|uniref:Nitronate monooxygenase domain-containing protein n=1 Tax=Hirsutella rhossiliensis TaxID=111463 RepID=A0A9P8MZG5_9HYPO|nr:nitronate monooxygenase domain-containing protein [Hirsutella rhossiliensis]KAH0963832.1 nitronate monooxygenase domain-containing protein [Hirsutella rhossiliensis]